MVEQRADHRGEERERHHGDEQVERDLAARLAQRHVEEDRAGQSDRDQRVAGAGDRVQVEEPDHADLVGGAPRPRRTDPAGRPRAGAHRAAHQQAEGLDPGADGASDRRKQRHGNHPD
jgi:hypothetical protein